MNSNTYAPNKPPKTLKNFCLQHPSLLAFERLNLVNLASLTFLLNLYHEILDQDDNSTANLNPKSITLSFPITLYPKTLTFRWLLLTDIRILNLHLLSNCYNKQHHALRTLQPPDILAIHSFDGLECSEYKIMEGKSLLILFICDRGYLSTTTNLLCNVNPRNIEPLRCLSLTMASDFPELLTCGWSLRVEEGSFQCTDVWDGGDVKCSFLRSVENWISFPSGLLECWGEGVVGGAVPCATGLARPLGVLFLLLCSQEERGLSLGSQPLVVGARDQIWRELPLFSSRPWRDWLALLRIP